MRPYPISVQLYSVREEAKTDLFGVLKKIAGMGYHAVEFAGLHGHSPKEVRKVVDDLGLKVSSVHAALPDKNNLAEIIETDNILGCTRHISGKGTAEFVDYDTTCRTADLFEQSADLLKGSNISLGIHNHGWEFDRTFGGKTPHQVIIERAPSVFFEIDTYWVAFGGAVPAEAIRRAAGRVPMLHIKDGPLEKDKNMTAVGDGRMKWAPIIDAAEQSGVQWLIVELDRCDTDMMTAVKKSRDYLLSQGFVRS